jgi:amino acid permease
MLLSCSVNLFIAAAGAGLLSYPWAMLQQGVIPCVMFSVFFCIINVFTDMVLVAAAHSAIDFPPPSGGVTYEHVVGVLLGGGAKKVAMGVNMTSCFGACVCFLILVADILAPVAVQCCDASGSDFICFFARSRGALIAAFAFTLVLPLSLADNMGHLAVASAVAALSVFVIAGILAEQAAVTRWTAALKLFDSSSALALGIPITIFSFGNHTQVVPLYGDLPRLHPLRSNFHRVVFLSNAAAFVL